MNCLIQLLPGPYACRHLDRPNRSTPRLPGREWLAFLLGILCLGGSAGAQNLVSNGSFELPVVSGSFVARSAGASMSGWTVGGAGIDHIGSFWLAAIQGLNQKLEEQRSQLEQKQTEITELKHRLEELERLVNQKLNRGAQ